MIMTASQTIRLETELLILGTGAAGCGAALAARQAGIRTLMVDKGKLESSGCLGGGNDHFIAVLNTDEPQDTIDDLVKAYLKPSSGYSEKQIRDWGEVMPAMVGFLEGEGVKLLHNPDGSYLRTAGRGEPAWYINIADGQMIKRLIARKIRSMGADVLDHVMITKLLKKDGRVVGAAGYNVLDGTFYVIRAAGVILALGNSCNRATANSTGNPYNTWHSPFNTGSQFVLAYEAGADIINMDDASERNEIYAGIASSVNALAQNYGIEVVDVKIKRFDLPEANENAVYARMISERNQIAEKYTADGNYDASIIRNDVDKQVNIIVSNAKAEAAKLEAEGEAEYMRILSNAYNDESKADYYNYIRSLDALKASLKGSNKTVILNENSELARILQGN